MRIERITVSNLKEILSEEQLAFLNELIEDSNPFQGVDEEVLHSRFSEEEIQRVKLLSTVLANHIYFGASYFVNESPVAADIARCLNTTVENVMKLSEMPEWKKAVRHWGWRGDIKPRTAREKGRVPLPLQEVYLLTSAFQKDSDVRLVTYEGFVDGRVKGVFKYDIEMNDGSKIKKHDVILAFPKDRMPYVKRGIERRQSIADLGLKRIERYSERLKIDVLPHIRSRIECVMRNGLVIMGEIVWFSKYNIVMRVGGKKGSSGKIILVYRHALHQLSVIKNAPKRQRGYHDGWDDEHNPNTLR